MPTSSATRSPGEKPVTEVPTAVTMPEDSCPRERGEVTVMSPLR